MKQKTKLIALISSFCLVLAFGVLGVLAVTELNFNLGGSVSFTAEGVNAIVGDAVFDGITPSDGTAFKSFEVTTNSAEPSEGYATWGKTGISYALGSTGQGTVTIPIENISTNDEKIKVDVTITGSTTALSIEANNTSSSIEAGDDYDIVITFATNGTEVNAQTTFNVAIKLSLDNVPSYDTQQPDSVWEVPEISEGIPALKYVGEETNVVIPSRVKTSSGTFAVTEISDEMFMENTTITSVVIPDGITRIGKKAFYTCENLRSVDFGNTVVTIDDEAFADCYSLATVVIPDSVVTIGDKAFGWIAAYGAGLSLTLGNSVETIGNYAFSEATLRGTLVIPDSVKTIGNYAFSDSQFLTSVVLGSSLETIGYDAFSGTPDLETITCYATTPPEFVFSEGREESNWFDDFTPISTIFVPANSTEAYESALVWRLYDIQPIEE